MTARPCASTGDRIATTSYDGRALVWRTSDGHVLRKLTVDVPANAHAPEAYGAAFSPDDTQLFVGFADGRGRIFRVEQRQDRPRRAK